MTTTMPEGFYLRERVEALRTAILEQHPRMPTLLAEIHSALHKQPENVTLLSEDDLAVLVQGLIKQTNTEFAKAAVSGKGTGATKSLSAKIKTLGADAF